MIELSTISCFRYIAVEFASIWRGMGAAVDLFYRKELPLRLPSITISYFQVMVRSRFSMLDFCFVSVSHVVKIFDISRRFVEKV